MFTSIHGFLGPTCIHGCYIFTVSWHTIKLRQYRPKHGTYLSSTWLKIQFDHLLSAKETTLSFLSLYSVYINDGFKWQEKCYVGFEVVTSVVMKSAAFWDTTPCWKSTEVSVTIYSSETYVDFRRTTRRYIPEDRTLREEYWIMNWGGCGRKHSCPN
jgi:hypothetical protein